ncbi:DUF1460 domain-containing protein [Pectobacterium brasiliense]|uniref:DUF1460 domain-containing protein n=1 Tax=Pectobacterium brasiliense TaxID=180957 RepID=UPI000C1C75EC|nr:DUF1460 domain-containing protein [Pectobacterium brasiliense]ATV45509.1 DUF1460 domain-containing protein [Pectobacterium brasiliense]MBA0209724.1 DUF1460 domain-containing protein [Pectobacterium brasiliense]MCA6983200.1 DUF1460 domain-containing protein [Pectobacterium brasiliense]MCH4992755.1 DUF1460 domain-containing protein [Pectobacterium brasiliense]
MKTSMLAFLFIPACLISCASPNAQTYGTAIDEATAKTASMIIASEVIPTSGKSHGEIIRQVSSAFLNTPYKANSLIGSPDKPEVLVANFNGVDCFTLVDYVEALSRSQDQKSFLKNLTRTRYTNSHVSYLTRRHFFTDWYATAPRNAIDVTRDISPAYVTVDKKLNRSPQGGEYVKGLGITARKINYIPGDLIDIHVLSHLKTGDYVGVYSPLEGLDVSHIGIVIRQGGEVWFRHASSLQANRKVIDSPFLEYMHSKPGIVVLRTQ